MPENQFPEFEISSISDTADKLTTAWLRSEDENRMSEVVTSVGSYKLAMDEIRNLWNAETGTKEHDRLKVLVAAADAYEDIRFSNSFKFDIDGHEAVLSFDNDIGMYRGEFENHHADFYAKNFSDLKKEARLSLKVLFEETKKHESN